MSSARLSLAYSAGGSQFLFMLRYLSGCGVNKQSLQGALCMFDMLTDESGPEFVGDQAPAELRAQAHSAAAHAYWNVWSLDTDEARAADHAELHRFGRPFNVQP